MGIIERKKRERIKRRSLILDTARALILERGVDSVTMQDIATTCELSKGALYLYFDNKEALLAELFHEAGSIFIEYVNKRLSPNDSGLEAIRTLWMSYIEVFGKSSDIIVLFGVKNAIAPAFPYLVEKSSKKEISDPIRLLRMIEEILARGIADGTLEASLDPERVAKTIFMITGGIIENIARLPSEMRNNQLILEEMQTTFEIVLRGIASPQCDRSLLVLPIE